MKILKLTNTSECLRIASAFIGSNALEIASKACQLVSVDNKYNVLLMGKEIFHNNSVYLPLETLKICPFIAMREHLQFSLGTHCENKYHEFDGVEISEMKYASVSIMVKYNLNAHNIGFLCQARYFLDLNWIQTIPGASIEEVKDV